MRYLQLSVCIKLTALSLLIVPVIQAQTVREPAHKPESWTREYQPFRIAGELYYVGTYDLACFLLHTKDGDILINTGVAGSDSIIKMNIEKLGFSAAGIKIMLTTQAHYDHVGGMAAIQKQTGALMMANEHEASVLEDGGLSDYEMGGNHPSFAAVRVDRRLKDGDSIKLGEVVIRILHHPGHTKGSASYLVDVTESGKARRVLIANMPTIISDRSFDKIPPYPGIAGDYQYTLEKMKTIGFDFWVASHASQFGLHKKRRPGDKYNPSIFASRGEYLDQLQDLQKAYDKKLQQSSQH